MSTPRSFPETSGRENYGLDAVEKNIIALLVAGYTCKESGERLRISEDDYRERYAKIVDKLKVANRLELILFAVYHRIVEPVSAPAAHQQGA